MNVVVKQSMWKLFGKKYTVSVEFIKKYKIRSGPLPFSMSFKIIDTNTDQVVGTISNKKITKADATIHIGAEVYEFKQLAFNTLTFNCNRQKSEEHYLVQGHPGQSFSIFKNNEQIAFVEMSDFVGIGGRKFKISQNHDENPIIIGAFIVLLNTFRVSMTIGGDIGWDAGNMGDGLTYYNPNWKPTLK